MEIHKDVLEALALCYLRIILDHGLGYRIDECRRIYHSDFIRLQILSVWRMDAAFQNLVQGIAADDGILVSTDASATHHQIGYHTC